MAAQKHRHEPLTALSHHLDLCWMHEAYRRVRKNAAPGVDGQTVAGYGENLSENLRDLLARAKSGSYQAPPVKRAYVPKNEKKDRPIGLPTVEDKILQRALAMILEPIYEQEFLPFSFGFRPGRSPHHALEYPEEGTPQGGVISPLLSNIYLHEVLDKWFIESVQPACGGRTFMVRFADDCIMGFESLEDAQKVQRVSEKRFARYGLKINAERKRGWCALGDRCEGARKPRKSQRHSTSSGSPVIGENRARASRW